MGRQRIHLLHQSYNTQYCFKATSIFEIIVVVLVLEPSISVTDSPAQEDEFNARGLSEFWGSK